MLIYADPATDWGRRVLGQLSDLPASAAIRQAPLLAGRPLPDGAAPAHAAQASGQALTAWLATGADPASREGEGTFIAIWLAGAAKPYTRRIAADWTALSAGDRSAALEVAALSVRSAVRSLLLDRAVERAPATAPAMKEPIANDEAASDEAANDEAANDEAANDEAANDEAASDEAASDEAANDEAANDEAVNDEAANDAATPRETLSEEPERASIASAFPLHVGLELGAAWQFYGRTALGAPGMRAGMQLFSDAWGLEVLGQYGWPVSARIAPASFELQRHALLAELSFVAADFGAWRFCPLLRTGLTWLRRDGTRADDGATPLRAARAESYRSPFVGAGAIAKQQLSTALSLSLRGVLNVETAIPTFTLVDTSGTLVSSGSPWSVQPSIEIGAHWRW